MPIVLYRVDERLIHGQVIVGWGERLRPDRYLVVDDQVAESPWEQELYRLGTGDDAELAFFSVKTARSELEGWRSDPRRSVLLTRDLASMVRLARGALLQGESVNLGGIHYSEGRTRVTPYLYLGDEERSAIRKLEAEGVSVSAMDVPGSARVGPDSLLGED